MSEILILDWSRDHLGAVVANEGSRGTVRTLATMVSVDHADTQVPISQAGESLRSWLSKEGMTASKTIVVVPRESVVIRRLQVPQAPIDELPDLVRFQAATRTSASIDSLALDFLTLPVDAPDQGQDVISCTIDRDGLNRIVGICEAARLEVQKVTVSSVTIAELVRSTSAPDLGMERPDLIVSQYGRHVEISVFDHGTLVFSHASMLGEVAEEGDEADRLKSLKSDLSRSLVTLGQSHPNTPIGRCFYVAGVEDSSVVKLLESRVESPVIDVKTAALNPGKNTVGYEALLGAVFSARDDRFHLDLLHPRKKREVPDRRRLYAVVGTGIVLLALGLGYSIYYAKKSGLENEIETLRAAVEKNQEQVQKGKPKSDAHLRLTKWNESDANPIALWNELRTHLGETDRLYFVEMRLVPKSGEVEAQFIGQGNARTRADVDNLNQILSVSGYRVRPTTASQTNRDPDYPWGFDLDVERLRPVQGPAIVIGSSPAASPASNALPASK